MTDNDCKILEEEANKLLYAYAYNAFHLGEFNNSFLGESFDRIMLVVAYRRGWWHGNK